MPTNTVGYSDFVICWFQSYLAEHTKYVSLGGTESSIQCVICAVPRSVFLFLSCSTYVSYPFASTSADLVCDATPFNIVMTLLNILTALPLQELTTS